MAMARKGVDGSEWEWGMQKEVVTDLAECVEWLFPEKSRRNKRGQCKDGKDHQESEHVCWWEVKRPCSDKCMVIVVCQSDQYSAHLWIFSMTCGNSADTLWSMSARIYPSASVSLRSKRNFSWTFNKFLSTSRLRSGMLASPIRLKRKNEHKNNRRNMRTIWK